KPNPDITVAAKSYVDARDDLKQNIIPKTGANSGTSGSTVVTYTDREGTIGERYIFDGSDSDYDDEDLVTAGVIADFAAAVENLSINNQVLTRVDGNGNACSSGDDCNLWLVGDSTQSIAPAGTFAPLTAALKGYGESATLASECASGYLQHKGSNKCGCATLADCPNNNEKCSIVTTYGCDTTEHMCGCF
ncbi:MAG: hypothetical protein IJQ90_03350, partial [Alphaproteobacteria bacterium]|nr:hypothetical protein [Alphaproteobacteria bacterium]